MRKILFFILTALFTTSLYAQTGPANYTAVVNKFKQFYNSDQPDSVFTMFSAEMKSALPLDKWASTTSQLKAQLGDLQKADFTSYNAPLAIYNANFKNGNFLLYLTLNAKNQIAGLFIKPLPVTTSTIQVDPSVTESPIVYKTLSGTISGTLAMPKNVQGKVPVVLIIAGSGPTDRDGNSPMGLNTNTYKMLANALGKNGIASLRYDKRMIGQSASSAKENDLRFEDYIDDAVGLIGMLNDDGRFTEVIVAGHSEGSLVGMIASKDESVKGFISLSGAGEPGEKILTEQMKDKPEYIKNGFKTIIDSLRRGKIDPNVDPQLYAVARPSIQQYLMSWCRYNPQLEIRKLKIPILIVQGTTDLQVGVDNAQKLKSAARNGTLVIVTGMNHILKDATLDHDVNIASYKDPNLPLDSQMVTAVLGFIKEL
jgi:pimeloyl-ACP methyl ester carboxylesterase